MTPWDWGQYWAVWGASILLGAGVQIPVSAQVRPIFNENPLTIEQFFGPPWSRLTTTTPAGDRRVIYTYSPGAMRSLFLNADDLRLSVEFINDQVERIKIHQDGSGFDIPEPLAYPDDYPTTFNAVLDYVFGDRPTTSLPWQQRLLYDNSGDGGTLHTSAYCINQGIAISYEWISTRTFVHFIEIVPATSCS